MQQIITTVRSCVSNIDRILIVVRFFHAAKTVRPSNLQLTKSYDAFEWVLCVHHRYGHSCIQDRTNGRQHTPYLGAFLGAGVRDYQYVGLFGWPS